MQELFDFLAGVSAVAFYCALLALISRKAPSGLEPLELERREVRQ